MMKLTKNDKKTVKTIVARLRNPGFRPARSELMQVQTRIRKLMAHTYADSNNERLLQEHPELDWSDPTQVSTSAPCGSLTEVTVLDGRRIMLQPTTMVFRDEDAWQADHDNLVHMLRLMECATKQALR
jgi:hypothetical protein